MQAADGDVDRQTDHWQYGCLSTAQSALDDTPDRLDLAQPPGWTAQPRSPLAAVTQKLGVLMIFGDGNEPLRASFAFKKEKSFTWLTV